MPLLDNASVFSLFSALILAWLLYSASIWIYRLYFHPLCRFPGPKIAAATLWHETYYDVWLGGQYTFKLRELHQKYGPIIRISPDELHVNDPEFVDKLYAGSTRKTDKYEFMTGQFGNPESAHGTVSHDLHRLRRGAINPFFSKASIIRFEPQIRAKVLRMCQQIETHYLGTKKPVPIAKAFSCTTTDIVTEYSFDRSYNFLDSPSFQPNLHKVVVTGCRAGPTAKHFPIVGTILRAIPPSIMRRLDPEMSSFLDFQKDMKDQIQAIHQQKRPNVNAPANIFEALVYGSLPPSEKSVARLWQEGQIVIGAGTETTARTLEVTLYYLLTLPTILDRLYRDLTRAMPDAKALPTWTELENVVYLIIIAEGLRLSYGVTTRLQRVAREPLIFEPSKPDSASYTIPPGTPVGMTSVLVHHDPDIFPEPERFKPDRWLKGGTFDSHLNGYILSFSKGTRQCVGINLAYAELFLNLAAIIRRFGTQMRLHDTTYEQDIECVGDYFVPVPRRDKGVEVMLIG